MTRRDRLGAIVGDGVTFLISLAMIALLCVGLCWRYLVWKMTGEE